MRVGKGKVGKSENEGLSKQWTKAIAVHYETLGLAVYIQHQLLYL